MAIFTSVVFNNLRNKLANTVLYTKRSRGIMRGKPDKISNPRTPDQLRQRAKMKLLVDLSRRFAPILKEGFRERTTDTSIYNAFISKNVPVVTVDDSYAATVDLDELICSDGAINLPDVTVSFADNQFTLTQEAQEPDGTGMEDDMVYAGLYESVMKSARLVKIGVRKENTSVQFALPKKWDSANVHIYAFAVSKSKRHTSPTLHVELT